MNDFNADSETNEDDQGIETAAEQYGRARCTCIDLREVGCSPGGHYTEVRLHLLGTAPGAPTESGQF